MTGLGGTSVDARTGVHRNPPTPPPGAPGGPVTPPSPPDAPMVTCVAETGVSWPKLLSGEKSKLFGRKHIRPGSNLRSACVRITCQALNQISIIAVWPTPVVSVDGIILKNHQPIPLSEGTHDCTIEDIKFQLIVDFPKVKA